MVTAEEAERSIFKIGSRDSGRYYGAVHDGLSLGKGLIYTGVTLPFYDEGRERFTAIRSGVLVLTHECDVDPGNDRAFNKDVVVIPIARFEHFFTLVSNGKSEDVINSYIAHLAHDNISQLMYMPHLLPHWPLGIVLYLNRITATHYAEFQRDGVRPIAALTSFGLNRLSDRLSNHLFRSKVDPLPVA